MGSSHRRFDLVVWGATGYTGRLVADAISTLAPASLRWAIGGRHADRLEVVRRALEASAHPPVTTVLADALDPVAMHELAASTRTVLSTVGPYARYGTALVEACAEHGTHYADLTAEVTWMRAMVDAHHERAQATGARIVHGAGFDSVPSDLGVWVVQRTAFERYGRAAERIEHSFGPLRGGVSGGTLQSAFDLADHAAHDPAFRRALANPDLLAPQGTASSDPLGPLWPRKDAAQAGWTAPFVMAAANAKVVRRTRHLLGEPWGAVTYLERLHQATWARAAGVGVATAAAAAILGFAPTRQLAARLLPKPGEGPSERTRVTGGFTSLLVGTVLGESRPIVVRTRASLDPGYGATSRMLAAMGLTLTLDPATPHAGILTPAVAGGDAYLARLANAGIEVHAVDEQPEPPR